MYKITIESKITKRLQESCHYFMVGVMMKIESHRRSNSKKNKLQWSAGEGRVMIAETDEFTYSVQKIVQTWIWESLVYTTVTVIIVSLAAVGFYSTFLAGNQFMDNNINFRRQSM
jgi:hypothetical protein